MTKISLTLRTWRPRSKEQSKGPRSQGSEPEPQQAGFEPMLVPTPLFLNRRLCCGLRACVWVGVIKYSKCDIMSSRNTAQLPALLVSVPFHLVFCHVAVPTGWTAKVPCTERQTRVGPSWAWTSCVTTGAPPPRWHHGSIHLAFQVAGKVHPGSTWELVSYPPSSLVTSQQDLYLGTG